MIVQDRNLAEPLLHTQDINNVLRCLVKNGHWKTCHRMLPQRAMHHRPPFGILRDPLKSRANRPKKLFSKAPRNRVEFIRRPQ